MTTTPAELRTAIRTIDSGGIDHGMTLIEPDDLRALIDTIEHLALAAYEYIAISTKLNGVHPNAFLRADKRLDDALRASGVPLVGNPDDA